MNRPTLSRRILIATGIVAALAIAPTVAVGLRVDESRSVTVSPDEARQLVATFSDRTEIKAEQLTVQGPSDGAFFRYYDVLGPRLIATVDANDGQITSWYLGSNIAVGDDGKVTSADALNAAEAFLGTREVSTDGLEQRVTFVDHGESSAYEMEWIRIVDNVVVPDSRVVGVDAASGRVFRYSYVNRSYAVPPPPMVDRARAEKAAMEQLPADRAVDIENTELRIAFTLAGDERLVWLIQATWVAAESENGDIVLGHALVEVDAESGKAAIVGAG